MREETEGDGEERRGGRKGKGEIRRADEERKGGEEEEDRG